MKQQFMERGWCRFKPENTLERWVQHALPVARRAVTAPENAQWLRCDGTWFVGVNALNNDADGAVVGGPRLAGQAIDFIYELLEGRAFAWDQAQVSVCYPGYPRRMAEESEDSFHYRLRRDAAHVDGLRKEGPEDRRFLRESHGFVLGIPMVEASADASPLVVWEGSHEIMRAAFRELLHGIPPERWRQVDCTEVYKATRRTVFETCRRIAITAPPGGAYVVHRLALHGIAPWADAARAGPDGRMISYFRPETGSVWDWLEAI